MPFASVGWNQFYLQASFIHIARYNYKFFFAAIQAPHLHTCAVAVHAPYAEAIHVSQEQRRQELSHKVLHIRPHLPLAMLGGMDVHYAELKLKT